MEQLTLNFMTNENPINNNRYSEQDLQIFRNLIEKKIQRAQEALSELKDVMTGAGNGTDDTRRNFSPDDAPEYANKQEAAILAHKQEVFISSLNMALMRIDKGTYGICIHTGELIDRNRLMAVPNTTTSLVAKIAIQNTVVIQSDITIE